MEGREVQSIDVEVLSDAADRLAVERRRIEDERVSFVAFEDALRDIEPATGGDGPLAVRGRGAGTTSTEGLEAVRAAYERTVMDVPHYDADYGDTYERSLVEEFGPNVAVAVVEGASFTERHKSVLLSAAAEARSGRQSMRRLVDDEEAAVDRARDELRAVETELADVTTPALASAGFGELESVRARLLDLEDRCEAGVDRRQETIARLRRRTLSPVEATDYREFCYAGMDVEYPVLSAYAAAIGQIEGDRREVERAMAYAAE